MQASRRRGRKVVPGRSIRAADLTDNQPSTSASSVRPAVTSNNQGSITVSSVRAPATDNLPSSSASQNLLSHNNATGTLNASAEDDEWICFECEELWEADGDDRWIVCDNCDKQFHLQCSGVTYRQKNYYSVDIENMSFVCKECQL